MVGGAWHSCAVNVQLPEVEASGLSVSTLRKAIRARGCLIVRGLLPPADADRLQRLADPVFAAREEHVQGAPLEATAPLYVPSAEWTAETAMAEAFRAFGDRVGALHIADTPRFLDELLTVLSATTLFGTISAYLDEPVVLSAQKTMLRRVPPDAKPTFHQDGSFMGPATQAVNTWVALSHCGDGCDAPGLGIVPRRFDTSLNGYHAAVKPYEDEEWEAAIAGVGVVYPTFAPGDALMFDGLLVHGNGGGRPGLSSSRYAIEMWTFAREGVPAGYGAIAI
ncbi:MAG: hypothetical protein QOG50_2865 [Actinomycetota bacterium]|jgi:hypothetical protein|nr:hypothetical protein [Actinomycetota bacterium]